MSDPMRDAEIRHSLAQAIFMLVMVTLVWGVSFPIVNLANRVLDVRLVDPPAKAPRPQAESTSAPTARMPVAKASFFLMVRFVAALLGLALWQPGLWRKASLAEWCAGLWIGLIFVAGLVLQTIGLQTIPASRSAFLTSLAVVFTPVLVLIFDRQLPAITHWLGAGTALLGSAILTEMIFVDPSRAALGYGMGKEISLGDFLTFVAAGLFAGQILLIDRFGKRLRPEYLTPGLFAAGLGFSLLTFVSCFCLSTRPELPALPSWLSCLSLDFVLLTTLLSIVSTVLAFDWMNRFQPAVGPVRAAVIYCLEPIFATFWAMLLPDLLSPWFGVGYASEQPSWPLAIGGAVILVGNCLVIVPISPRSSAKSCQ